MIKKLIKWFNQPFIDLGISLKLFKVFLFISMLCSLSLPFIQKTSSENTFGLIVSTPIIMPFLMVMSKVEGNYIQRSIQALNANLRIVFLIFICFLFGMYINELL